MKIKYEYGDVHVMFALEDVKHINNALLNMCNGKLSEQLLEFWWSHCLNVHEVLINCTGEPARHEIIDYETVTLHQR